MAVPRRKTSPSRRGMRRSADAIKKPTYVEDKDSGELRRPHHLLRRFRPTSASVGAVALGAALQVPRPRHATPRRAGAIDRIICA